MYLHGDSLLGPLLTFVGSLVKEGDPKFYGLHGKCTPASDTYDLDDFGQAT